MGNSQQMFVVSLSTTPNEGALSKKAPSAYSQADLESFGMTISCQSSEEALANETRELRTTW